MSRLVLINEIIVAYSNRIPIRDYLFRLNHKSIAAKLMQKGTALHFDINICDEIDIKRITNSEEDSIIKLADKAINNTYNYLGSGDCRLAPINWSIDFKSCFEWPVGTYYKRYKQVDFTNDADVKVPRELSRSHFLLPLALAYRFTKEDKYAEKAYELIGDWIDNNPLMYSINWGCTMDVAIRAVNWIWALSLIKDYNVDKNTADKVTGSLYQHGWFIYRNPEGDIFKYNHNHYLSDIVGLLYIGGIFRNDKNGGKWYAHAKQEFYREVRLQVLPCGMCFERTFGYNRLVLELVLAGVQCLKMNGDNVPADIEGRLECMFDFVAKTVMPNGEMPIVGDQDNGRCLPFGTESSTDCSYLLRLGEKLYNRPEWQSSSYQQQSRYFRDAGFALMRSRNDYLLFNVDNHGMYSDSGSLGAHTHADLFSFVLVADGVPFIVDPGTYCYTSDFRERNRFRSTAMHNTVVVDGKSQEEIPEKELWRMNRDAVVSGIVWTSSEISDSIMATHSGYARLEYPVSHTRKARYDKQENSWIISDELVGEGAHTIELFFHFDVGVEVTMQDDAVLLCRDGIKLKLSVSSSVSCKPQIVDDELSRAYGEKLGAKTVKVEFAKTNLVLRIETKIQKI